MHIEQSYRKNVKSILGTIHLVRTHVRGEGGLFNAYFYCLNDVISIVLCVLWGEWGVKN